MSKLALIFAGVAVAGAATVARYSLNTAPLPAAQSSRADKTDTPVYAPKVMHEPVAADQATQERAFMDAARSAWAFVDHGYAARTGFVAPSTTWPYPTIWDIASAIGSYYSAAKLGLITADDYQQRTRRALETLKAARLYHNIAYGRNYDVNTGELVGLDQKPSANGTGFSSMDLGRLLVWLKIVAQDNPQLAPLARQVALRLDAKRLIRGGYLQGEQIMEKGVSSYQEGRIGYEQYAATGFDLWGMHAGQALQMKTNVRRVKVDGIPVSTDKRGLDRLTSEPFITHGLELGLSGDMREMAWQTLAMQANRYDKTGQITIASEDALNEAPYYFYYYCVYCSGKAFIINVHTPGLELDAPRWISSKAAFAWHALMPSKYTWLALNSVKAAELPGKGWATGVYEKTGKSTGVTSLNTAAIILEAAAYYKSGKPLLQRAS